jgi:hypothetical protein
MVKSRTSVWNVIGLLLVGILALPGCHSRSSSESCRDWDAFCDGNSMSLVVERERSKWGHNPLAHSGSYLISRRTDFWLVNWSLQNETVKDFYLGKHEEERTDNGNTITKQSGHRSFFVTGQPGLALIRDNRLTVLDRGVEQPPGDVIQPQHGIGRDEYVFTRSRKHVFAWLPEPAIYSIPDMKVVKKLAATESFQEFEKLFRWRENKKTFLTEDLAYLIAVPHNGASESERGFEHTKAFCYAIDRDEVSTVSLQGLGDALIWDAEPVADGIHWLVRQGLDGDRWFILDSDSHLVSELSLPDHGVFWDPAHDLVWTVHVPEERADRESVTQGISIIKVSTLDGSRVQLRLPHANLVVP